MMLQAPSPDDTTSLATRYGSAVAAIEMLIPELERAYQGRPLPESAQRRIQQGRAVIEECDRHYRPRFQEMDRAAAVGT